MQLQHVSSLSVLGRDVVLVEDSGSGHREGVQVEAAEPRHHLQIEHLCRVGGVASDLCGEPAPLMPRPHQVPCHDKLRRSRHGCKHTNELMDYHEAP